SVCGGQRTMVEAGRARVLGALAPQHAAVARSPALGDGGRALRARRADAPAHRRERRLHDVRARHLRRGARRRRGGRRARRRRRAGLPEARGRVPGAAALGFPGPLVNLFFFRHHLFASRVVRRLVRRLFLWTTRGTATVGWLRGPWATPHDWFAAGRMLMRFWLELTRHDLYLQPFGS